MTEEEMLEQKFDSPEELAEQLKEDEKTVMEYFNKEIENGKD